MKTTEQILYAGDVATQGPTVPWRKRTGDMLACGRGMKMEAGNGFGMDEDGLGDKEW
jgi:hypothetical protein